MTDLFDRYRVIDVDTHVSEPADTWSARLERRFLDAAPQLRHDPRSGKDIWYIGDELVLPVGMTAVAGFDGILPECPDTMADIPPAAHDPHERLAHLDREGIHAQVLYPNVGGFGSGAFLKLKEPELMLACVRAYNDMILDWAAADPKRLVPIMATPFWDVAAAVREIERCAAAGHRGVLFGSQPRSFGEPPLPHPHWAPIWAAAQAAGLFDDDPVTVEPERWVADVHLGVTARFRRYSISYAMVRRSEEFERTVEGSGDHSFASLSLTVGLR